MHLSRFTTFCPSPIFWFAHPLFLTSLRQCFRSTVFDPNTAFIRPVLLYLPVQHALSRSSVSHPLLVPSPFFLLTPVIRPNLSRHDPGYHLPCHTLSFFLRHSPLLLYILLVYPCLPDAVPHLSTVVGPNYHPPVLSIALLPHAALFSTELHCLQLFLVPLPATRLSHYVCIPSCPSVVSFRPSVCVCSSAFLLPRLVTCLQFYQSDFDY